MMRNATVLAAVVLAATLAADPVFPVADFTLGVPPGSRSAPALATDGDGYLAVWSDSRSGDPTLLAARVSAAGEVLDPTGIALPRGSSEPHVVWNGEHYLVFFRVGGTISKVDVKRDGTVSSFYSLVENAGDFDVATNGTRIIIAYEGDGAFPVRPRVRAAVLDLYGFLAYDAVIDSRRSDRLDPSIAVLSNGEMVIGFNVEEADRFNLHAVRLSESGARRDFVPRIVGGVGLPAELHANADALVAVSEFYSWGVSADLTAISEPRERPPGEVFQFRGRAGIVAEEMPTHTDATTRRRIEVSTFNAEGYVVAPTPVVPATPDGSHVLGGVAAIQKGSDVLLAWTTFHYQTSSDYRLSIQFVDAQTLAPKSAPALLTKSAPLQQAPAIASGVDEMLVAWNEERAIYASRVYATGEHLDGRGIEISDGPVLGGPRVVFHDGLYAIAFVQEGEIVVRFVSPRDGLQPQFARIPLGDTNDGHVGLASGGGTLLVTWADAEGIRATRVHTTGGYDPPLGVASGGLLLDPVAAWNGSQFLIAWASGRIDFDIVYLTHIAGRRITRDLLFVHAGWRELVRGEAAKHEQPALASDGKDWFLAWTRTNMFPSEVRLAHIDAEGVTRSEERIGFGDAPEVIWTGTQIIAGWKEASPQRTLVVGPRRIDAPTPTASLTWIEQFGLAPHRGSWVAAFPRIGGAEVGHVPRVYVAFPAATKPKRRAMR